MCASCINTVTTILNNIDTIKSWKVDTTSPTKTLTINTDETEIADQIVNSLGNAGYRAKKMQTMLEAMKESNSLHLVI